MTTNANIDYADMSADAKSRSIQSTTQCIESSTEILGRFNERSNMSETQDYGTLIRNNLMTREGYTPYCVREMCYYRWPRTAFNGQQFVCRCGWQTQIDPEFIQLYKEKWNK